MYELADVVSKYLCFLACFILFLKMLVLFFYGSSK